ncbi:sensor histidine kinase [Trueperella sp. LYQ143]|uniref:sensor histidine kinase n=1 Tax=Trueperella sp. LYQ143 TaxID=3391059 RepID=UPI003982E57F
MPTLSKILAREATLTEPQEDWLHQLTGDWQIIADITFSDLVLYIRGAKAPVAVAQARPATAHTVYRTDQVGFPPPEKIIADVKRVLDHCESVADEDEVSLIRIVPVRFKKDVIAAMAIVSARRADRVPSQALANYEAIAHTLIEMVTRGEFPAENSPTGYRHGTPRVPDGLVHVDADGVAKYVSPNAVSHFRRFGIEEPILGSVLAEQVSNRIETAGQVDEALPLVLMGRASWMAEAEAHGVVISLRAVPLHRGAERLGAVILCRDITELRRQERELISKDSTIREINHRVKNNLQTVSALLRMQARRADSSDTRSALETAQRRVATIAVVHEKLSQTINEVVDFDSVFVPVLRMVRDAAVTEEPVIATFHGTFGMVRAEQATALGVVMNEIISNAIEHGLPNGGRIDITAQREGNHLHITVADNGIGVGPQGPRPGLGMQIVKTMVNAELKGNIEWSANEGGGVCVDLDLHIRSF